MAVAWRPNYLFYRKYLYNFIVLYKSRQDFKMFLEILLSLGTVSVFGVLAIKPTLVTIANLTQEISSKEETVQTMDQKIQNIQIAQQIFEEQKDTISLLNQSVPAKPQPIEHVKQIEALATKHNVFVETINSSDIVLVGSDSSNTPKQTNPNNLEDLVEPLPENAYQLEINFSVSGDYQNLIAFLKDIEQHRRPFAVDRVSFDSIITSQEEKIVLIIKGRLPYLRQNL